MPMTLEDLMPSYRRFFESTIAVKICPKNIDAPEETLSFNTLTLAVSLVIFIMARSTVAGASQDIQPSIIAMIISAFIAFVAGYITVFFMPNEQGLALGQKWTAFLVHIWLSSLIALITIDGIASWTGNTRISSIIIDWVFVAGYLEGWQKDLIRAVFFSLIALGALLIKTKRQDAEFKLSSGCWIAAAILGLAMNSILLLLFVYGNLI